MSKIYFSINSYDSAGTVYESGIFIHFGDTRIKVGEKPENLDELIEQLKNCSKEIKDQWNWVNEI